MRLSSGSAREESFIKPPRAARSGWWSRRRSRNRRNDHECLGRRSLVGNGEINSRLVSRRCNGGKTPFGSAGKFHGGTPRGQIHHAHVPPPYAGAQSSSERLRAGFLGGESLGLVFYSIAPPFRLCTFGRGEEPVDENAAVALD